MPDGSPRHDAEATARAQADEMGLGVLDAVDVGGTWTVVGDGEATAPAVPATAEPPDRRPRRRLLWIGLAAATAVLLLAMLISRGLPGPRPAGTPPPPVAAPGATGQPGTTASTPRPTATATHTPPAGAPPAGQPQPTGSTPARPRESAPPTPLPSPTDSPPPTPTPTSTIDVTGVPISPTSVPPPSPA